jgi:ferric-dicitrate binding protein FerR (iron transport regulator)
MKALAEQLGIVEAERFVALIQREPFDYTQWRQGLFEGVTLNEFLENARNYSENMIRQPPKTPKSRLTTEAKAVGARFIAPE